MDSDKQTTIIDAERDLENSNSLPSEEPKVNHEPKDPNIVDWDGPDDPANPLNWTGKKKWTNGALLATMTLIT
jgi:hypothetical protein